MSWPEPPLLRRRLAAIGLSLCVAALELILAFWGFSFGVPVPGSPSHGANGISVPLSVFNLQAVAATRPAQRAAKATPLPIPKPKLAKPAPLAVGPAAIDPDLVPSHEADEASLAAFEPLSGQHGAEAPCSLAQDLARDLQANPLAQRALERIPARSTSIAGALLLWDGRWLIADTDPGAVMLREIVLREVLAAKPDCLAAVNIGPQFLFVSSGSKTTTIVIGSGQWRWGDLTTSP
ncbi:hypothetical protein EJC47_01265 [Sphingomonas sp. TF3]|uniref:hypothetical protein n=1 Tax=Sphingomonas sp. TF3 TaxID=2495580 RepID=UPI000F888B1A|nr:hypothetical protein [Sphingomonas sp. TF3]RUN78527.1 hypothetical protein EJC47_01265 [Sphingomonas sp. TF3]